MDQSICCSPHAHSLHGTLRRPRCTLRVVLVVTGCTSAGICIWCVRWGALRECWAAIPDVDCALPLVSFARPARRIPACTVGARTRAQLIVAGVHLVAVVRAATGETDGVRRRTRPLLAPLLISRCGLY
jgi:hypothetical protein